MASHRALADLREKTKPLKAELERGLRARESNFNDLVEETNKREAAEKRVAELEAQLKEAQSSRKREGE